MEVSRQLDHFDDGVGRGQGDHQHEVRPEAAVVDVRANVLDKQRRQVPGVCFVYVRVCACVCVCVCVYE